MRPLRATAKRLLRFARGKRAPAATFDPPAATPTPSGQRYPTTFQVTPKPAKIAPEWPEPPVVTDPEDRVRYFPTFVRKESHRLRFDVELFEKLNAEYETKPIYPKPPVYDTASIAARTHKQLNEVHHALDLSNKRVLEIGCGTGYHVWFLAHHFNAQATGLDVAERNTWKTLTDDKTKFVWADITDQNPFPENSFDRVISFAVWEHILHPHRALKETYKMLAPGGLMWLNANLYRGPLASHIYREVKFPWPHLLFADDVIKDWYTSKGKKARGATWVNKLTWAQYEQFFAELGFKVKMARFIGRPFDKEFYDRFEDVLNRYPIFDLSTDFFTVVLEKPKA